MHLWMVSGLDSKILRGYRLDNATRQKIYIMWIQNSVLATDNRNSRSQVKLRKTIWEDQFHSINDESVEESINKRRGIAVVASNRTTRH